MSWYEQKGEPFYYVNRVAFATALVTGAATIGGCVALVSTTSVAAGVALGIFTLIASSAGIASMTSYTGMGSKSMPSCKEANSVEEYVENMKNQTPVVLAASVQFIAQAAVQALVQGFAQALGQKAYRKTASWLG